MTVPTECGKNEKVNSAISEPIKAHHTIGVRELRDGLSRHLALIRAGSEITVTDHGKPVARLVPIENDAYARLVESGRLIPATQPDGTLPQRRNVGPVSDLIER